MLFEERCAGCDRPGAVICRTCRFSLVGQPPAGPDGTIAAVAYQGKARDVVLGLKYGNRRPVACHLAGLLVNRLVSGGLEVRRGDVVTWAPTSGRRRRERGFDQAELIARQVARQLGLPCRRLLRRQDDTAQTGLGRAARLDGPPFVVHPRAAGHRVIVVDDVATTGSTLQRAADALSAAGARHVVRAAVAATPDPRTRARHVVIEPAEVIRGPWREAATTGEHRRSA